jgi:hypothetical protein
MTRSWKLLLSCSLFTVPLGPSAWPPVLGGRRSPDFKNFQQKALDGLTQKTWLYLDHTVGAPAPSGESAAEAWQKRLLRSYMHKRLWVLIPLMRFTKRVARLGRAR